jgi:shikimate kinase
MINEPILFILGPSGVGKTDLGNYLQKELNLLHLDFDVMERGDVIKELDLRDQWNELFNECKPQRFVDEIRKRCREQSCQGASISFVGNCVFLKEFLKRHILLGIRCVILYGSAADCIKWFLHREKKTGRGLPIEHWLVHNPDSYIKFSLPVFDEYRLNVFDQNGRRPNSEILAEIESRLT